jgi:integrase
MIEAENVKPQGRTTMRGRGWVKKRCGCARRAWAKCPHPWYLGVRYGGQEHRVVLSKVAPDARANSPQAQIVPWLGKLQTAAEEGRCPCMACERGRKVVAPAAGTTPELLTFERYGARFLKMCPLRRGKNKGGTRGSNDKSMLKQLAGLPGADGQPLGDKAIDAIMPADIETALLALRDKGRAVSSRNKSLQLVKLLSSWGARKGYLSRPWITEEAAEDAPVLQRGKGAKRDRRVSHAEEQALLQHASPLITSLMIAAIETGGREGELLNLQCKDVSLLRLEMTFRDTKTGQDRTVPVSTRLWPVLELLMEGPDSQPKAPSAFVFGSPAGERPKFPRRSWEAAVLRANGMTPKYTKKKALTPECRAAFHQIDLRFHDLRHEAGSRLAERRWPLHHVQTMLGHANLSQTSTYLNATLAGLHDSMRQLGSAGAGESAPAHISRTTPAGDNPPMCATNDTQAAQVTIN